MYFAKHETFHIRDGWLYKGLRAIQENPNIFLSDDAPEQLGLGNNMVRALRFWLQATGLSNEEWSNRTKEQFPTKFGELVLDCDPYLELDGTLWLVHYHLVSSRELATSWYWFFNHYAPVDFTRAEFVERLSQWISVQDEDEINRKISERSLQKDFDCLVRTYLPSRRDRSPEDQLECPLSTLELIASSKDYDEVMGKHVYRYRLLPADSKTISPLIFLYILLDRQRKARADADQVNLNVALREAKNVGRVFNIGMRAFEELLTKLENGYPEWRIHLTRTGGLDQLTLPSENADTVLETYYEEQQWL